MSYLIHTPCGELRGTTCRQPGVAAFKGIRYATAERWKHPVAVTHWDGVYTATQYGHCSYQPRAFYNEEDLPEKAFYYNEFRKGETYTYSEDCLFLNVWTPEAALQGGKLPVLVYIHGGGFTGGCGHEKHFDDPIWPTKGVVAVTLNYRLGPLGFLTLPELAEEAGATGNYGLYDQMTAMQWVKDNIRAFGGDPDNITIMGQSAGAMSVQQHCLSPLTDGLFQKAIMSSGGGVSKLMKTPSMEKNYGFWKKVMAAAGCETLEQFRAVEPKKLFTAWQATKKAEKNPMAGSPCLDGRLLTQSGTDVLAEGRQKQIPYMAGSTSHDVMPPIIYQMSKDWCKNQAQPCFSWFFDRKLPGDDNGAWHSSDLWYWFGTLDNCWRPMEQKDYALSGQMTDYLTNFCKTGNPNGAELPAWHSMQTQNKVLRLGEGQTHMGQANMAKLTWTLVTNKAVGE